MSYSGHGMYVSVVFVVCTYHKYVGTQHKYYSGEKLDAAAVYKLLGRNASYLLSIKIYSYYPLVSMTQVLQTL